MAKKSNDKAAKTLVNTSEAETDTLADHSGEDTAQSAPLSKKELRAESKKDKKASKSATSNSSKDSDEDSESKELLAKLPREKRLKGPLLNLAVITFFLAIIISIISVVFPFRDVVSVNSDVVETLSVEVTISAPQFISAPAISACRGSGRLAGLPNASINLAAEDGSWKVNAPLGLGQLNSEGNCVYTPEIETPESFEGGVVKARVDFSFGSTSTYTVDGYSIALDINLDL